MIESKAGHGEKRSRKQEIFIACLLTEPNIREAASKSGISEATGFRWLQEPDFNEHYREARRAAVNQAISQLQQVSSSAVQTLKEVMADQGAPPASKVSAAKAVLEMAFKAVELDDLAQRIEKLEESIQKTGGAKAWR